MVTTVNLLKGEAVRGSWVGSPPARVSYLDALALLAFGQARTM